MAKIKYFIDFDDTLFNRNKFWNALIEIMSKYGLEEEFKATYKHPELYRNGGYEGAKPHLMLLKKQREELGGDITVFEKIGEEIEALFERAPEFLYPEAIAFLQAIDRNKYDVKILTVGGKEFQRSKVKGSGIEELVGEANVIYTTQSKDAALAGSGQDSKLVEPDEQFILLEDKQETIDAVRASFPNANVVRAVNGSLMEHLDPGVGVRLVEIGKKEELAPH
ncbi:MAG TPA: hypothetical protein PK263_04980 [bacterium]|nr:hypothetical protein [bacterium]